MNLTKSIKKVVSYILLFIFIITSVQLDISKAFANNYSGYAYDQGYLCWLSNSGTYYDYSGGVYHRRWDDSTPKYPNDRYDSNWNDQGPVSSSGWEAYSIAWNGGLAYGNNVSDTGTLNKWYRPVVVYYRQWRTSYGPVSYQNSSVVADDGNGYWDGSSFWCKPGAYLNYWSYSYDNEGGTRGTYIRLANGSGVDARAWHDWTQGGAWLQEFQHNDQVWFRDGYENQNSGGYRGYNFHFSLYGNDADYSLQTDYLTYSGVYNPDYIATHTVRTDSSGPYWGGNWWVSNADESGYDFYINGVGDSRSGVRNVLMYEWTNYNGQDDLQGIWADYQGNGTWHVRFPRHGNEVGAYMVDFHLYDNVGNESYKYVGNAINLRWNRDAVLSNTIPSTMEAGQTYNYSVTATNTGNYGWIENTYYVRLGAVGDNDPFQSNRQYIYPSSLAVPTGSSYTFNMSTTAPTGTSNLHSYYSDWQMLQENVTWFGGSTAQTINVVDTTGPTSNSPTVSNINSNGYDVTVTGLSDIGTGVNRVQFPTWTNANGQDDLASSWQTNSIVTGQNLGSGTWKFHVDTSAHNNEEGLYYTHVYGFDNVGNSRFLGSISVNVVKTVYPTITATPDNVNNRVNLSWTANETTNSYTYTVYRVGRATPLYSNVSATSGVDTEVKDIASPNNASGVNVTKQGTKVSISFTAPSDNGTGGYQYYVVANGNLGAKGQSPNTSMSGNVTTGVNGYSYSIDTSATTDPGNTVDTTSTSVSQVLNENTTYYFHIKTIDKAGNISGVSHTSFTTPSIVPTITATADNVNNKVNLTWGTNDTTQSYLYDIYRDGTLILNDVSSTSYSDTVAKDTSAPNQVSNVNVVRQGSKLSISFTNATDNGNSYTYYMVATGQSDGKVKTSANSTATVNTGVKGYAYTIDKVATTDPGNTVNLTTNSISQVFADNNTYYLHIKTIDNAGLVSGINNTTMVIPDIYPTATSVADSVNNKISLSWSINDTTQTYLYDIYKNGTLLASNVNGTSYVDTTTTDTAIPNNISVANINRQGTKVTVSFASPTDNGTTYTYYVVAKGQVDGVSYNSNNTSGTITKGISGYSYKISTVNTNTADNTVNLTNNSFSTILNMSTTYYLDFKTIDSAGNVSGNYKVSFSIPTITTTATSSVVNGQVKLDWSVNDTTQAYKYDIYRDGVLIQNDYTGTTFTDTIKEMAVPNAVSSTGLTFAQDLNPALDYEKGTFSFTATTDNGTTYTYYVVAQGQSDGKNYNSNNTSSNLTSGVKGYGYIIDGSPTTNVTSNTVMSTTNSITISNLSDGTFYLHLVSIDNNGNISSTIHKQFTVSNLMKISGLTLTAHVDSPTNLTLPYSYPAGTPAPIKVGYNLTFAVPTESVDELDMEFYVNGSLVKANNMDRVITNTNSRLPKTNTVTLYLDKYIPKGSVIDIKLIGRKFRADGTEKDIINTSYGVKALQVTGSSLEEAVVNQTN